MKKYALWALVLAIPWLMSADPVAMKPGFASRYVSPEGIQFLSYTKKWTTSDLRDLHNELLRNQHGDELNDLQEVRVIPGGGNTLGEYNPYFKVITLYQGDKKITPDEMRDTLSHEYGHHIGHTYIPDHMFPFSRYAKLRVRSNDPVRWNMLNGYEKNHEWYLQEIFAEDYVQLYGSSREASQEEIDDDSIFWKRSSHENENIPLIDDLPDLHQYVESKTGLQIDPSRLVHPTIQSLKGDQLHILSNPDPSIEYRLSLTFYKQTGYKRTYLACDSYRFSSKSPAVSLKKCFESFKAWNGAYDGIKLYLEVVDTKRYRGFDQQLGEIVRRKDGTFVVNQTKKEYFK